MNFKKISKAKSLNCFIIFQFQKAPKIVVFLATVHLKNAQFIFYIYKNKYIKLSSHMNPNVIVME